MAHGGKRAGAGRPPGTGLYGEKTVLVRVPASKLYHIKQWLTAIATETQKARNALQSPATACPSVPLATEDT